MKHLLLFFITGLTLLSACNSHSGSQTGTAADSLRVADTAKTATVKRDTFKINEPGILFTNPDDDATNKLLAKDSDAFYTIADDNAFYNSQIIELADSLSIKTSSTSNTVLDFKTTNNKHFIIDRSKLNDMEFSNFLFNGVDTPKIVEMEYDKIFLKKYFNK